MRVSMVVACTAKEGGIGLDGKIPWKLECDIAFFKHTTTSTRDPNKINVVIMGRKTWESLPKSPLPNRLNVVISTTKTNHIGALTFSSLQAALDALNDDEDLIENIFIIGGQRLYEEGLKSAYLHKVFVTWIYNDVYCDTFFPRDELLSTLRLLSTSLTYEENGVEFAMSTYTTESST